MKKMMLVFGFFCILWAARTAHAEAALVERVVDVQTTEKNPATARSQMMNQASEKVSEDLIREIIGEQKLKKNRPMIVAKIMKKSASYLPFAKAGEVKTLEPEGFQMSVTLRASLDQLQALLLENGLFYDSETMPSILPVIRWSDRVGGSAYSWWNGGSGNSTTLTKASRDFESSLQESFLKSGFLSLRPQAFSYSETLSPADAGAETPSAETLSSWTQLWGAQILLNGQVLISRAERPDAYVIELRLSAQQSLNNRTVAEVARKVETDAGPFETVLDRKMKEILPLVASDLSSQVLEAWKQGSINSQLYRMKILGRMSLPMQDGFREAFRSKIREIKAMKERLITAESLSYEIDSAIPPTEISSRVVGWEYQGLSLVPDSANEKEVVFKLKRVGGRE